MKTTALILAASVAALPSLASAQESSPSAPPRVLGGMDMLGFRVDPRTDAHHRQ